MNINQSGFCKQKFTTANLVPYDINLLDVLESRGQIHSIYAKLLSIGFSTHSLAWLTSFLKGTAQNVKIKYFISSEFEVSSVIPQESNSTPLLFNLIVNGLCEKLKHYNVSQFTDDVKLYYRIDCLIILKLNADKFCYVSFSKVPKKIHPVDNINKENLNYIKEVKNLRIWFT